MEWQGLVAFGGLGAGLPGQSRQQRWQPTRPCRRVLGATQNAAFPTPVPLCLPHSRRIAVALEPGYAPDSKPVVNSFASVSGCVLCGLEGAASESSSSGLTSCECRRCGRYEVATAILNEPSLCNPYLSAAARQVSESGDRITIEAGNVRELIELHRRTTVAARVDKTLRYLASKGRPGTPIWISTDLDFPAVGAENKAEFGTYLVHLDREEGMIRAFSSQRAKEDVWGYVTTVRGWRYLEPSPLGGVVPGTCFVAMWFDPRLDAAFEHGFAPGIRDAGFEPHRIDQANTNRGISDEILARIRTCEFVVADFTGQRQSVYFEAGFARGLGKEVIWCCRSDEIGDLHFDTKHLGHVTWDQPADLRTKIRESIQANIVRRAPGAHDALFIGAGPYLHREPMVRPGCGPGT